MLKILFADDSMTAQNMGKKILTDAGYDVIAVSNGAAAAKKILEQPPDIAILDVHMPGYTGFEVCAKIRSAHETAKMPVLLTVGKMEPYSVEDGARVKADGVIIKPFEASVLLATVRNLAERLGPAPSESGNFGTMRIPVPAFEEFRDESYAAWKADTAQMETVGQTLPPSIPVPPAMANAPAYGFDETIAIPPPVPPPGSAPVRETVEMETLSAGTREKRPGTQPLPSVPLSVEETQPIHPYVDPYEEEALHAFPVHAAQEPDARQEFTAVFSAPEDSAEAHRPPPVTPPRISQPASPVQSSAVVMPPLPPAPATTPAKPPDTGALETFAELDEPAHIQIEPELELTAYAGEDVVVTPDPAFEHTAVRSTQRDVPTGTAPGLVTSGMEALEIYPTAAASVGKASPENPPDTKEAEVAAAGQPESHDAAFEKLVSELLAQEPAPAVADSPEVMPASQEKPPQGFFSKYLGFGRTNRPPGTGPYPHMEETSAAESLQAPKTEATPGVPASAFAQTESAVPGADDLKMDFESNRGTKPSAVRESKIPETKIPPGGTPPTTERRIANEAGVFVGTRDFRSTKPGTPPGSSIPFTASAFRDEPVKPHKESHGFEDLATKVPPFAASFHEEPPAKTRKEPHGFEDLGGTTVPEPAITAPEETTHGFEDLSSLPAPVTPQPPSAPAVEARVEKPVPVFVKEVAKEIAKETVATPAVSPARVVVHKLPVVDEPVVQQQARPAVDAPVKPAAATAAVTATSVKPEVVPQMSAAPAELPQAELSRAELPHAEFSHAEFPLPEPPQVEPEEEHDHATVAELIASEKQEPVAETVVHAEPVVTAPDHNHMMDAELAQQLAAALEQHAQHAQHAQSAASVNGQPYTMSLNEAEAEGAPILASIDTESVSLIITRVLDRMVPEIIRLITVELDKERSK